MVFEARAKLLDWYGSARFDEPSAFERAKALRRLRKIRGEIDDNRVYVDPLRFGQWLQDNQIKNLSVALQSEIETALIDEFKSFSDFAYNRQPHVLLAATLQQSFTEFCTDKRYGIDLSAARILHELLKVVTLVQLQSLLTKGKYRSLFGLNMQSPNTLANGLLDMNEKSISGDSKYFRCDQSRSQGELFSRI